MNALKFGEHDMLINLCQVFRISPAVTGENKRDALAVLALLFVMPSIEDRAARREFGNLILRGAHEAVPPMGSRKVSQFQQQVAAHVAMMQTFPGFHGNFRHSDEALLRKHKISSQVVRVLKALGVGNAIGAANSASAALIEKKGIKYASKIGASRLIGASDLTDAIRRRVGAPAGRSASANAVSAALLALGTAAFISARQNLQQIELVADHRFKTGELSENSYRTLFPDSDPRGIGRYWEY